MKKLAIMQPYIFPYIGYFQLINAVDKFIFYDDVNFIKQGWIARNQYLNKNEASHFVIPLDSASSFRSINEIKVDQNKYSFWRNKFLKALKQNYGKAPYYAATYELVDEILSKDNRYISQLAISSVRRVCQSLNINTNFELSSEAYPATVQLGRLERIIELCKRNQSDSYINAIGGIELYQKEEFEKGGIILSFLKTNKIKYKQFKNAFVPNLSIIDVMMFNSPSAIKEMLNEYNLV